MILYCLLARAVHHNQCLSDPSQVQAVYYVTVFASTDGTYNRSCAIRQASKMQQYTVNIVVADSTVPALTSIVRNNPAAQNTDSQITG